MSAMNTTERRATLRAAANTSRHPAYPTHPYAGSCKERAEIGKPGHCEQCAEHGHVVAHPDLGCSDVGCGKAHDDEAPSAQLRPPFALTVDECLAELRTAVGGWITNHVRATAPAGAQLPDPSAVHQRGAADLLEDLYRAAAAIGDRAEGRHLHYAAEQLDAGYVSEASETARTAGVGRTFYQSAVAYARQAQEFVQH